MQVNEAMPMIEIKSAPVPADDPLAAASDVAARLLRAMGHAQRLRILCTLLQGPRSSGEIAREIGMREPAASQQLALLKGESLVSATREGKRVIYSISHPVIARLVAVLHEAFCETPPSARP